MQRTLFDLYESSPKPPKWPTDSDITSAKERHPGMVLAFHVGDCYQFFDEDAILAAKLLGLVLTSRNGRSIAGFPRQSLEPHLRKLLESGHHVALCEFCDPLE